MVYYEHFQKVYGRSIAMDLFEAIAARHSYRGMYQEIPVPREHLKAIMKTGLAAPSGCNKQTTSLIGVDDPTLLAELGAMLDKPHFASAPAAIVVATQYIKAYGETCFSLQDYSAAIENMLLAITALGYASCWVEGYVTGESGIAAKMEATLRLPEGYHVVAYLPLGLPTDEKKRPAFKAFEARAWFNGYEA